METDRDYSATKLDHAVEDAKTMESNAQVTDRHQRRTSSSWTKRERSNVEQVAAMLLTKSNRFAMHRMSLNGGF